MNKESIYKIIGYNGEYSESVKKALKKLLKENHPDHNGDSKIFNTINEVKHELETGNVSFRCKKKDNVEINNNSDIDLEYCEKMRKDIKKNLEQLEKKIIQKKENLNEINEQYKEIYQNSYEERKYLLNNNRAMMSLKRIKTVSILLLIFISVLFIVAIINNSMVFFSAFGIMCLLSILIIIKYFNIMKNIAKNNENNLHKYVKITSKLHLIIEKREKISLELWELERKKNNLENDLRFYNNLLM